MKNFIIIPCYNEANRLHFDQFKSFIETNANYRLCFVNDGSSDDTLKQLRQFASKNLDSAIVHNLAKNQGKAEAVKKGTNYILNNYNPKSIGFMDADLATGFDDYKNLVQNLFTNNLKVVFGSRKMNEEGNIDRSPFRKMASGLIGMLIKIIIGLPIQDSQCGAKVFMPSTARFVFKTSFLSRWLFDVEMFIRIKNLYAEQTMNLIKEVPVTSWEEVDGSHITFTDSIKFPKELLEIGFNYNVLPQINKISNIQIPIITNKAA